MEYKWWERMKYEEQKPYSISDNQLDGFHSICCQLREMIDSNKDKECERNTELVESIKKFFNEDNTMVKSEWNKLNEKQI